MADRGSSSRSGAGTGRGGCEARGPARAGESGRHGVVGGLNAWAVPDHMGLAAGGLLAGSKPSVHALGLGLAVKIENEDSAVPSQPP